MLRRSQARGLIPTNFTTTYSQLRVLVVMETVEPKITRFLVHFAEGPRNALHHMIISFQSLGTEKGREQSHLSILAL